MRRVRDGEVDDDWEEEDLEEAFRDRDLVGDDVNAFLPTPLVSYGSFGCHSSSA